MSYMYATSVAQDRELAARRKYEVEAPEASELVEKISTEDEDAGQFLKFSVKNCQILVGSDSSGVSGDTRHGD